MFSIYQVQIDKPRTSEQMYICQIIVVNYQYREDTTSVGC